MNETYSPAVTGAAYPQVYGPSYPVSVEYPRQESYNRFWAIPLIGRFVKSIIVIPHLIVLAVLGLVVSLLQLVIWIPVLFTGRYPEWGYNLVAGYIRWHVRLYAYFFGLSDTYSSFTLQDVLPQDTQTMIAMPVNCNRFWAIPIIGYLAKAIILIPHAIILVVLFYVVMLVNLVTWIPVLFGGQYPEWGLSLVGGYYRWSIRVSAFSLGLTDQYPPFQLAN